MKSSDQTEQVRVRKTNEVNPPKTRRYELKCRRNQDRFVILGRARRVPDDWAGGDRRRGGVSWTQAFAWNCGTRPLMRREKPKRKKTARRDYRCRGLGGSIWTSVDGPVMGPEQRDRVR